MEDLIKSKLSISNLRKAEGNSSNAMTYIADGRKIFVKTCSDEQAFTMFTGESEGLKAIRNTSVVHVPDVFLVIENHKGNSAIVMEFLELEDLSKQASALGHQLARLHLHNIESEKTSNNNENYVGRSAENSFISKFGFHVPTFCGRIPQSNQWCDNWMDFYAEKIDMQVKLIMQKYNDRTIGELWSSLQLKLHTYLEGITVTPSLLHGDLWSGNVGTNGSSPVIFDPSSFYGHHEFDLAIADLFGGFPRPFWSAYHELIPKSQGWDRRHQLYTLFHQLNHWSLFGSSYKRSSLENMRALLR